MRKVLAVASVGCEHKELVLKDLKKIFKRIKISPDVLLQEEFNNKDASNTGSSTLLFKAYPYITLTIPNYEQHREYLEKVYKNNVLFSKFILLISKGENYQDLIKNRSQDILREQCRNWNVNVSCEFDSTPAFTEMEEQVNKMDKILGGMDIRGKISKIDAQKRFHLIEDHRKDDVDDSHLIDSKLSKKSLLKIFFGLEVARCDRKGRCGGASAGGITIAADSRYAYETEFIQYEEETTEESDEMMMEEGSNGMNNQNIIQQSQLQEISWKKGDSVDNVDRVRRRVGERRGGKRRSQKIILKETCKNPYLKKKYPDEVVLSQQQIAFN